MSGKFFELKDSPKRLVSQTVEKLFHADFPSSDTCLFLFQEYARDAGDYFPDLHLNLS